MPTCIIVRVVLWSDFPHPSTTGRHPPFLFFPTVNLIKTRVMKEWDGEQSLPCAWTAGPGWGGRVCGPVYSWGLLCTSVPPSCSCSSSCTTHLHTTPKMSCHLARPAKSTHNNTDCTSKQIYRKKEKEYLSAGFTKTKAKRQTIRRLESRTHELKFKENEERIRWQTRGRQSWIIEGRKAVTKKSIKKMKKKICIE